LPDDFAERATRPLGFIGCWLGTLFYVRSEAGLGAEIGTST
jgi:hypothetical protein